MGIRLQAGASGEPRRGPAFFLAFFLASAACDERPIGDALIAEDRHASYLADKGFSSLAWERRWLERYGALVAATPKENSRRAWVEDDRRWAAGKRQMLREARRAGRVIHAEKRWWQTSQGK